MSTTITLAGNPNCGKTTMFNNLTGSAQYVGNWPGVTVEKKSGKLLTQKDIDVIDLPGIYSLSPYSPEEVVSRDFLLSGEAGGILNLVDASSLERNLYLTTQILEIGSPVVVALNMMDIVRKNGDKINTEKLSEMLGCPIFETSALKNQGIADAAAKTAQLAAKNKPANVKLRFSKDVEAALSALVPYVKGHSSQSERWYLIKLFERDALTLEKFAFDEKTLAEINSIISPIEDKMDDDSESIIISERYETIQNIISACVVKTKHGLSTSDKIDKIVTNRWLALPIFALIMFVVYFVSVTSLGTVVTDWTNDVLFGEWIGGSVASLLATAGAAPWLSGLLVDGIIGGVGAVLGFVPQLIILFLFLSFLEDCGYMARVAFIMDRIFRKFGLSGKSFIPMLISSGCAVPGITATKTIESEKDRRMTIITTSFIPCGAKLPIIALITGSILGGAWWVSPLIYFVGVGAVIISGIILKKTKLFAGEATPFVMELPQYHLPSPKSILLHVWERVKGFVIKAGTVIFASSILIWVLLSFGFEGGGFAMIENIENSFMAMLGGVLAPVFAPLGFGSWQASVGVVAGLVAKENLVSTLAIIQGLSGNVIEGILDDTAPLWAFMQTVLPTFAAGLSFLIFNMICAPCFAAIGAIRRQMNSGKWTAFAVAYQTIFAYALSLMVFQFITFFATGIFSVGTASAIIVLLLILFLLFRKAPKQQNKLYNADSILKQSIVSE